MASRVFFTKENILRRFEIKKDYFYKLTRLQGTPLKKVGGHWCCVEEDMVEFIRNAPSETSHEEDSR